MDTDAIALSVNQFQTVLIRDAAGLFWIAAELAILFLVVVARGYLARAEPRGAFRLSAADRQRAVMYVVAVILLIAATYARHLVLPPLHTVLLKLDDAMLPQRVYAAYHVRAVADAAVWAGFIAVWVVLEPLIVWHGWHVCKRVRGELERAQVKSR